MKDENDTKVDIPTAFFRSEDGFYCSLCFLALLGIGYIVSVGVAKTDFTLALTGLFIFYGIITVILIGCIFTETQKICPYCKKRVYPVFRDHYCQAIKSLSPKTIQKYISDSVKMDYDQIKVNIKQFESNSLFRNSKEKLVFERNLKSLKLFEFVREYKYSIIAMGSILEFLLIRYCFSIDIKLTYTNKKGKEKISDYFVDYVQVAIKKDIFSQKKRWEIVQTHLRNFRNYIHISKENKEDLIDFNWYITMKPVFEALFSEFKKVPFKNLEEGS